MQALSASSAHPTPLPNVIGSYHHAHGPFRSRRCQALDEQIPDHLALAATEDADHIDIADYHIMPIVGRRPGTPAWIAAMTAR